MTEFRRLQLLRAIGAGDNKLGAGREHDLEEWKTLESLGDVKLSVRSESMTAERRLLLAVATVTGNGRQYLEDHADELGGA